MNYQQPLNSKPKNLLKTPQGTSVLSKMLQGGTPEQIKARMTAEDNKTIQEMLAKGNAPSIVQSGKARQ